MGPEAGRKIRRESLWLQYQYTEINKISHVSPYRNIYGMIDGDPHQYVESFQATPMPSAGPLHTYTPSQLEFFKENHDLHPEIDEAAHQLYDKGVLAEMECYRRNKAALERNLREEAQIQNDIWKRRLTLGRCAHHMAGARILQRIEVVNRSKLCLLMQEYKHHCGRRS